MSDIAIKVENLGKLYRLGEISTGTISHDLNRFFAKIRGKEDPYAKLGETNDRATKGGSDYVWSLKDVNFEINQGDAVGIIGRNGAGKSTLLKLLSKVTSPTTGNIKVKGRIASLLEVGTGFHPELTGRENIYLNGAILGMSKKEITRKFDEIVDFSGVERYIDTPVKRYSSGMYVRLAFAVAAHLESEILIVDEVLAVGDAEFQKKCLGKMGDVAKGEGRTVLFVSHNMSAVQNLCTSSILMEKGKLVAHGTTSRIIEQYHSGANIENRWQGEIENNNLVIYETYVRPRNAHVNSDNIIYQSDEIEIGIKLKVKRGQTPLCCGFNIDSSYGYPILRANYNDYNETEGLSEGTYELKFVIQPYLLSIGSYVIRFDISIPFVMQYFGADINIGFDVVSDSVIGNKYNIENMPEYVSTVRPRLFLDNSLKPI
ncbi:MAG: ABC transporter ATP-binding protein [Edaphocola sp.]